MAMPRSPRPPATPHHIPRIKAFAGRHVAWLLALTATRGRGSAKRIAHLASLAAGRGDHEAALRWWTEVSKLRPDWSIGYAGQAGALRGLNRWHDARQILHTGLDRLPDDIVLTVELGWFLIDRNELHEALPAWRKAMMKAPDQPGCHVGFATTLRQMLRFDEADATLAAATLRFPASCFVFTNYAVTADVRGDRTEALLRWQTVFAKFSGEPIAFAGLGAALKALGRFDEAEAVLIEGMDRFPDDRNVAINHAQIAVSAADWSEAIRRWSVMRTKWPDDTQIRTGLSEASMQAKLASADAAAGFVHDVTVHSHDAPDDETGARELMMCFESIGENCELAFVQRHFEAEPLGLFRWAGISYDRLVEALANGFSGIGAGENTILSVNPNNREYYTHDSRYGMSLHSFILEGDVAADVVKMKLCRRIAYLKDKLARDLQDASKIFVFNTALPLSDSDLRRLHAGLCQHRPVSLLHVAPHSDPAPGAVTQIDTRLWRGSLGRTGFNGRIWDIEFDTWLMICRTTVRLNAMPVPAIPA